MQKILNDLKPSPTATETSLGARVRQIRKTRKWTLKELSDRTGLAISTISKMERGEISLTYDRFMRLAQGLGLDVGELFDAEAEGFAHGTITVTRAGEAPIHRSATYDYDMLASDVSGKHMVPMVGRIKAHSFAAFEDFISHPGEEFIYVLAGEVTVFLKGRDTITLRQGDSIYFDSGIGHAYVSVGDQDAMVLGVCWKPT
ncbi:helix-turn-helix domain-containing protein [Ruegeria sp. PrR005]|uniref:Helix-turn-helix domain-containing protein n=1 Tax=Ruegeria sp. PrR005 TaxID=2706882 RepID=A0A6B2NSR2_9RHOB|nr:XRE family transcriptional regulator [Ruegeria sp. PrR005]NDW45637.1 helix-turn-helix domain-containing protein [Ruegeria sp. PrR005]